MAISNAETREREELNQLFEEAYERCRTAPMEGVSFTLEEFHSALEKYDFNSELGTKVSEILFLSFSFSILVFSLFLKIWYDNVGYDSVSVHAYEAKLGII